MNNESTKPKQCQMVAQYDGANACALLEGHAEPHVNYFGNEQGPWGTKEEFAAISRGWYVDTSKL